MKPPGSMDAAMCFFPKSISSIFTWGSPSQIVTQWIACRKWDGYVWLHGRCKLLYIYIQYIYCRCNFFRIFLFYCIHRSFCTKTKRCLNSEWPIIIMSIYKYKILLFLDLINSVLKSLSEEMYPVIGDQPTCSRNL